MTTILIIIATYIIIGAIVFWVTYPKHNFKNQYGSKATEKQGKRAYRLALFWFYWFIMSFMSDIGTSKR